MNLKLLTAIAATLQLAALGAVAGDEKDHAAHTQAMKSLDSQSFVDKAAVSNLAEIQLGQLALQKSQDTQVRQFADRMVKDHSASLAKLKTAAGKDNTTVASTLDAEHQKQQQELSVLNGAAFDEAYGDRMEKAHHKTLALLESAQKSDKVGPALKEYAASTLPTVKTHAKLAETLEDTTDRDEKTAADR